eukprot:1423094-Prymnesium_polylepis.1
MLMIAALSLEAWNSEGNSATVLNRRPEGVGPSADNEEEEEVAATHSKVTEDVTEHVTEIYF